MFSTCYKLTPCALIPDGRMERIMQPWWKVSGIKIERTRAKNFFFADGEGNQRKKEFCLHGPLLGKTRDIGMGHKRSNYGYEQGKIGCGAVSTVLILHCVSQFSNSKYMNPFKMRFLQYPFLVLGLVVKNIELSLHAKPKFDSLVLSYKNMMADKIPSNFCTSSCHHYSLSLRGCSPQLMKN